jgi:glutamine---fructose-6-phosphate transaminase (isomerizing)
MRESREFPHHMLREIHEHPRTIRDTFENHIDPRTGAIDLRTSLSNEELRSMQWIRIMASGTSRYAGLYGKYVIEELSGVLVDVEYASEFELRKHPQPVPMFSIVISQSGETSDTLAALRRAKQSGSRTLAISNVENSTMMREADSAMLIKAGPELSVPSTKAFGGQLACLAILALFLAQAKKNSVAEIRERVLELASVPQKLEDALRVDPSCARAAAMCREIPDLIFFGRGPHYPVTLDGALKCKEAAYIHAEAYPGGEFRHGQITLIDDQITALVIATCDSRDQASTTRYARMLETAHEIRNLSGRVIAVANYGDETVSAFADDILRVPSAPDLFLPLIETVPLQLLAYHLSVNKGLNPDAPRNLCKSVTH